MKSSEETKPTVSRFRISEHQLSLGLLALLLLSGSVYGIWQGLAPFLPKNAKEEPGISRLQEGVKLFESGQWSKSISAYNEMLVTDPDNGLVRELLAIAAERIWRDNWSRVASLKSSTGNANAAKNLLASEEDYFSLAKDNFEKLLDHARYRNRAYEKLASIYGFRYSMKKDTQDADLAIGFLTQMIDNGITTQHGINRTRDLQHLREHRSYSKVVQEESRIFNFNDYERQMPWSRAWFPQD